MTRGVLEMKVCPALLIALVLIATGPLWVQDRFASAGIESGSDEDVLRRISDAFSGIVAIESEFIQESHTGMLEEPLRSSGLFRYEAPGFVHWEVLSPERFGFSAEGDRLRTWRGSGDSKEGAPPGAETGIRHFMEQLLAWVRADFDWLGERFEMSVLSRSPIRLELEPRSEAAAERLDRMLVTFSRDLDHLESIEIRETNGDRMVITFSNVRVQSD